MSAYYNEIDPFAAAWLRELMKAGLIADGEVDERSITDVSADDVRGFVQCHFFAGIGGWSYALRLAGWADDRAVWTGSCPCQPFSSAGSQVGGNDPRHLWPAWFRLIAISRPRILFGEQVENAIAHGWMDLVCDDLESTGYAVWPASLPATAVGANHERRRLWFVADADKDVLRTSRAPANQITSAGLPKRGDGKARRLGSWWATQPEPCSVVYGLPGVVDLLRPFGNAIVPQVAQLFIESYMSAVGVGQ
jgi:DNA (cytosine-5)-methyltransferase 1